jgi:hypothetical protein
VAVMTGGRRMTASFVSSPSAAVGARDEGSLVARCSQMEAMGACGARRMVGGAWDAPKWRDRKSSGC